MILIYAIRLKMPEADMRTLVFTTLVILNMGLILVNRSFSASLINAILKPNRSLWILMVSVMTVLAVTVFWQPARLLFHFGEFHWSLFAISILASIVTLLILEAIKWQWFSAKLKPFEPLLQLQQ